MKQPSWRENRNQTKGKQSSFDSCSPLQAEAKAEEAVRKMEALLTSWLPHWLEQRYHQVRLTHPSLNPTRVLW